VSASPSGGTGTAQLASATPSNCASPCKNAVTLSKPNPGENDTADMILTVQATNPGGVKSLSLVVSQGGPVYTVGTSSAPDAQGRVPETLQIWGTNGAGGIGSDPLLIHLSKFVHAKTSATIVVQASNFNGDQSIYAVTYHAAGHVQASLSVADDHLYDDQKTTVTWTTRNADQWAIDPPLPGVPLPLAASGSKEIGPLAAGDHTYTLTASDWLETAPPQQRTIAVEERPQVGGNISTHVTFSCANTTIPAQAAFGVTGQCVGSCTKPNPSSQPSFYRSKDEAVTCSNGVGGLTIESPSNLVSGTWTVTATPNMPFMNLPPAEAFTCTDVKVKAGESITVNIRFVQKPDLTWQKDCVTSP
jgi:hypothetical protein